MWYASYMPKNIPALTGKPFVISRPDNKKREIGNITRVQIAEDRHTLYVAVDLTDEVAAALLGQAQQEE